MFNLLSILGVYFLSVMTLASGFFSASLDLYVD